MVHELPWDLLENICVLYAVQLGVSKAQANGFVIRWSHCVAKAMFGTCHPAGTKQAETIQTQLPNQQHREVGGGQLGR